MPALGMPTLKFNLLSQNYASKIYMSLMVLLHTRKFIPGLHYCSVLYYIHYYSWTIPEDV